MLPVTILANVAPLDKLVATSYDSDGGISAVLVRVYLGDKSLAMYTMRKVQNHGAVAAQSRRATRATLEVVNRSNAEYEFLDRDLVSMFNRCPAVVFKHFAPFGR